MSPKFKSITFHFHEDADAGLIDSITDRLYDVDGVVLVGDPEDSPLDPGVWGNDYPDEYAAMFGACLVEIPDGDDTDTDDEVVYVFGDTPEGYHVHVVLTHEGGFSTTDPRTGARWEADEPVPVIDRARGFWIEAVFAGHTDLDIAWALAHEDSQSITPEDELDAALHGRSIRDGYATMLHRDLIAEVIDRYGFDSLEIARALAAGTTTRTAR